MPTDPCTPDAVAAEFHRIGSETGNLEHNVRLGDLPAGKYVWAPDQGILVGPFPDSAERTEYLAGTGAYPGEYTFQVTPDACGNLRPNNFTALGLSRKAPS